jgi:hypothetical protein
MKQLSSSRLLFFAAIIFSFSFFGCSSGRQISSETNPLELAQAINNDQWVFTPTHTIPTYGRSRDVNGAYFVKCNRRELTVALPYYGRLTSPAGVFSGNPLDFYSGNFKLYKENFENSRWSVTIESPNPEVRSMVFTFYDNGTAQLSVVMTNRSGISFTGTVEAR